MENNENSDNLIDVNSDIEQKEENIVNIRNALGRDRYIKFDMYKLISKLLRPINTSLYYNDRNFQVLHYKELIVYPIIMKTLYYHMLETKDSNRIIGLTTEQLKEKSGLSYPCVCRLASNLSPFLIDIMGQKKRHKINYHSINKYGIIFVEKFLELERNARRNDK